jgi:NADPH-dependent ferric siderophore reductase
MALVTMTGTDLEGMSVDQPASSVRLLLPSPETGELVVPSWNGNEFLMPDGRRPIIRTVTPLRVDSGARELDVAIVLHGAGAACEWAGSASPGDPVAISGPGRGYAVDRDAASFFLAGDETAIPAIIQLLEAMPPGRPVQVRIEVAQVDARIALPEHSSASVKWLDLPVGASPGDALADAVRDADLSPGSRVWVAGEAAAVQRVRRHLFEERGLSRSQAAVRGYWKHGRSGDPNSGDPNSGDPES